MILAGIQCGQVHVSSVCTFYLFNNHVRLWLDCLDAQSLVTSAISTNFPCGGSFDPSAFFVSSPEQDLPNPDNRRLLTYLHMLLWSADQKLSEVHLNDICSRRKISGQRFSGRMAFFFKIPYAMMK